MELKAIKEAQNEIIETQNRNCELAEGQFKALRQNVHHMSNCIQYLYVREQINQHSLLLDSIFQAILANIKTPLGPLYVSNQYSESLDASHETTITNVTSSKGAVT